MTWEQHDKEGERQPALSMFQLSSPLPWICQFHLPFACGSLKTPNKTRGKYVQLRTHQLQHSEKVLEKALQNSEKVCDPAV